MAHELAVPALMVGMAALLVAVGFLLLVWRFLWCLQGYVATELQRSKYEERIIAMLHDYIETQRVANEHLSMSVQVQADRLNRFTARRVFGGMRE